MNTLLPKDMPAAWHSHRLPTSIKLRRLFRPLAFRLLHPFLAYLKHRARKTRIGRLSLRTNPHVFHPGQHFSSRIFAEYVAKLEVGNRDVLDMGTGSGIIGITAALQGARVTAIDINPHAVLLAGRNAREHNVQTRMRVFCGDLFDSLSPALGFDWIIFNPPFFARHANGALEHAYNAGENHEVIVRFLKRSGAFLKPDGRILMIVSSDMDLAQINRIFNQAEYRVVDYETKPHIFEIFYILHLAFDQKEEGKIK